MSENSLYWVDFVLLWSFQEVATKRNDLLEIPQLYCKRQKIPPRLIHVLKWHILQFPFSFSDTGKEVSKQTARWQTLKRKHLEFVQKLITPNTGKLGEKPWFSQLTQMPAVGSGTLLREANVIKCICTSPGHVFLLKQNTAADIWQCVHQTQKLSGLIVSGCAAPETQLKRMMEGTNRSHMKIRERCPVPQPKGCGNNLRHQYMLGATRWKAALQDRTLGSLAGKAGCEQ